MAITDETRRIARARRQEIVDLTDDQVVALVSAWVDTYDELAPELERIAHEIATQFPEGATPAQLDQAERVQDALRISRERAEELAEYAGGRITQDIPGIAAGAGSTHQQLLRSQLPGGYASVGVQFGGVNEEALAAMVARTTSRIHSLTQPLSIEMETAMKRSLTRGIVDGANPRETARRIMRDLEGDFMGGVARATTIARTESISAFRDADLISREENVDLVKGWRWYAELDSDRTCIACAVMHGQEFASEIPGPEGHPNCRCVSIVVLKSWDELGINAEEPPSVIEPGEGKRWFQNLTPESQESILGPGRYAMWANNQIEWEDLAVKRENPDWRAAYYETPLKDLAK